VVGLALWRGLKGWWLRAARGRGGALALLNPSWRQEDRAGLSNIALVVVDETASNRIGDRAEQTAEALEQIEARLARLGETAPLEHRSSACPTAATTAPG
jgi:hypothetical protein